MKMPDHLEKLPPSILENIQQTAARDKALGMIVQIVWPTKRQLKPWWRRLWPFGERHETVVNPILPYHENIHLDPANPLHIGVRFDEWVEQVQRCHDAGFCCMVLKPICWDDDGTVSRWDEQWYKPGDLAGGSTASFPGSYRPNPASGSAAPADPGAVALGPGGPSREA